MATASILTAAHCGSEDSSASSEETTSSEVSLADKLKQPGNVFGVASDEDGLKGNVLDTDADGVGDGIDVNNDGESNMLYGALSVKPMAGLSVRKAKMETFAFHFAEDSESTFYFYLKDDGTLGITSNPDGPPHDFIFKLTDGKVSGLDNVDDDLDPLEIMVGIVPFDFSLSYGGTCNYTQGDNHQCFEFKGAAYHADQMQTLCETNFGAANVTFSTEDKCPTAGAVGYCERLSTPPGAGEISFGNLHLAYSYDASGDDNIKTNCEDDSFDWIEL